MRSLLLFIGCVCSLGAQVPGTEWELVSLEPGGLSICVTVDNPSDGVTQGRIIRTTSSTPPLDIVPASRQTCAGSNGDKCCMVDTTLKPGTTYLVHPSTYDGATDSAHADAGSQTALGDGAAAICGDWNGAGCTIVDDGSGNDILEITTPALPGTLTFNDPVHPTHASTLQAYTITGGTTTLTVNGSNEVQNFQATLTSVVAALEADSDGEVYGIKFPAGSVASPDFEAGVTGFTIDDFIDTVPNSRLVIFCEATDSDGNLPLGGRSEDIDKPCASIRFAETKPQSSVLLDIAGGRVHFVQVTVEAPRHDQVSIASIAVNSVALGADTKLNLASAATAMGNTFGVRVPSLQSPWFRTGYNNGWNGAAESDWVLSSGDTVIEPETNVNDLGSDGTGIVYWPSPHAWTASKESGPTLTFGSDHQASDGAELALTSISSGVATVTAGAHNYDLPATNFKQTFYVEGSTGGCDGVYTANSSVPASGTITLAGSPTGCTGGTIRQVYPVLLHHMVGPAQDHMSCLVTFETTTTARILDCWYGGSSFVPDWTAVSGTPSGYMTQDPPALPAFLDLRDAEQVTFSSGGFNARGLPWRQGSQVLMGSGTDFIFAGNNHLAEYYQVVNPHEGKAHADTRLNAIALGDIFNLTYASDLQVYNTAATLGSFLMFSPNGGSGCPQHHTWGGILLNTPLHMQQGSATNGVGRPRRQDLEYKQCIQFLWMYGIHRANQVMVSSSTGAFISAQTNVSSVETGTYVKSVSDLHFEKSFLQANYGFFIGGRTIESSGGKSYLGLNARAKMNDIIWQEAGLRGGPSNQYLEDAAAFTNVQGPMLRLGGGGIEEFQLSNFTILPTYSDDQFTAFVDFGRPSGTSIFKDGIIMDSGPLGANFARMRTSGGSSAWSDIEDKMYQDSETTLSANSEVSNFLVVQCTDDAEDHDFASANDPANVNAIWNVTGWNEAGRVELLSTDSSDSCQDRMDAVFAAGGYIPLEAHNDKGADWEAVLDAQGRIRNGVQQVTETTVVLTYKAPTTNLPCSAALAEGSDVNFFTASTVLGATDTPGGSQNRTLTVTGLSPATTYSIRLSCQMGGTVRGLVTTL